MPFLPFDFSLPASFDPWVPSIPTEVIGAQNGLQMLCQGGDMGGTASLIDALAAAAGREGKSL